MNIYCNNNFVKVLNQTFQIISLFINFSLKFLLLQFIFDWLIDYTKKGHFVFNYNNRFEEIISILRYVIEERLVGEYNIIFKLFPIKM